MPVEVAFSVNWIETKYKRGGRSRPFCIISKASRNLSFCMKTDTLKRQISLGRKTVRNFIAGCTGGRGNAIMDADDCE